MGTGSVKVFHRKASEQNLNDLPTGFHVFGTCIRTLVLSTEAFIPSSLSQYKQFHGAGAYEQCLKVLSGADSAVFGETQVLGQFKDFLKNEGPKMSPSLRNWLSDLMVDVKKIRTQFMQNLGSHSYGSLLRREIQTETQSVAFIGAGQLSQEILPWIIKSVGQVRVFSRNPEKYGSLSLSGHEIKVQGYQEFSQGPADIVVVAAPVQVIDFQKDLERIQPQLILDLRGHCDEDPFAGFNVRPLTQLFREIQANQLHLQKVRRVVEKFILNQAQKREMSEKPRPFGWDDLWAI